MIVSILLVHIAKYLRPSGPQRLDCSNLRRNLCLQQCSTDTRSVQLASASSVCAVNDMLNTWVVCVCIQLQREHFVLFGVLDK